MAPIKPITPGTRFGRLTVLRAVGLDPNTRKALSECRCACGAVVVKRNNDLLTGRIRSCGCLKRERSSQQMWKRAEKSQANHMSGTPIYQCWRDMIRRCTDPRDRRYKRYGGRGISVHGPWLRSFRCFRRWAEAHGFRPDLQIDRIDYDKGYAPTNCRFVDRVTQANNRSNNHLIEYDGKRLTMAQWARQLNIPYHRLKYAVKERRSLDVFENHSV